MLARSASITAVSGSARTNGWNIAGKRSAEKKTPEKIHMGSMTKFIRPDAPSIVLTRDAMSSPTALNESAATRHNKASSQMRPLTGTPKTTAANPTSAATSTYKNVKRDSRYDSRY